MADSVGESQNHPGERSGDGWGRVAGVLLEGRGLLFCTVEEAGFVGLLVVGSVVEGGAGAWSVCVCGGGGEGGGQSARTKGPHHYRLLRHVKHCTDLSLAGQSVCPSASFSLCLPLSLCLSVSLSLSLSLSLSVSLTSAPPPPPLLLHPPPPPPPPRS